MSPRDHTSCAGRAASEWTFSLGSLMLLIALNAVYLAAFRVSWALGLFLVIVTTPALVRTALAVARREIEGRAMTVGQKLMSFLDSLWVVTFIGVAAGIAFATCFPLGMLARQVTAYGPGLVSFGIGAGAIAGGGVACALTRELWPSKDD